MVGQRETAELKPGGKLERESLWLCVMLQYARVDPHPQASLKRFAGQKDPSAKPH